MPNIEEAKEWYPENDPVHGFEHVLRVLHTAERLARLEGADLEIVRAAVLLHDAVKPGMVNRDPVSGRGQEEGKRENHHLTSAEFAGELLRKEGWTEERAAAVQHCIRAHRFRDDSEQPETLEAKILFDADKLDAIGAIGAARAIAYAAMAGQSFYSEPSQRFWESGQLEAGEVHSAYHEYVFKLRKLPERLYTASARQTAAERSSYLDRFFKQLAGEIAGER